MKPKYLLLISILFLLLTAISPTSKESKSADDFLQFWTDVKDNYAYFDKKHTDWDQVKTVYLPKAEKAKTRDELVTVFENAIEELYDNHFNLNTNLPSSTRLVPTGLDIWAEWINDKAIITEVRKGFSADKAGIKSGMEIVSINGTPTDQAVNNRIGKCINPIDIEAKNYALKELLAGTYLTQRVLVVSQDGETNTIDLDKESRNLTDHYKYKSLLESRTLDDNIGYIKINNSVGETEIIQLFDDALAQLKDTRGLIIDLRETPSGGNSIVARGILSRFTKVEMPYQKHVLPNEEKEFKIKRSWLEIVSPRGPFTYDKQVVVLVNHWTGSMSEGLTIGFSALGKAKIVGTRMAGLNGAINGFKTTRIEIPYSFPTEQLYHVNGTPRETFTPPYLIDLTDSKYKKIEDPILAEGINLMNEDK
ncbi:MAG TPA: peptidase [Prolixibacteraceae bacterium]|jgi:carboxyl-terminal processing protease|nr:peptidase [Prolixibacteraceae bacterium]